MKNITPFVSVVGIGQMGLGIAKNIQNAGYLNSIFEINESVLSKFNKSENLIINDAKKGLKSSNVLIFIVPSTTQIRDFLFGSNWIDNINENTIVIDLTTSNPDA
ncbi:MAG: NAD(P)-binding domain-containing protein, partial [Pseudomonadota bacterium]|nr:NAD(P)-binding domain-containing protein [Pseudomonadota bacterium]